MKNAQEIAETIKSLCIKSGITINKLLLACHINTSFINDLEKKGTMPSVDKIAKIAKYFNVTTDYLLGMDEE